MAKRLRGNAGDEVMSHGCEAREVLDMTKQIVISVRFWGTSSKEQARSCCVISKRSKFGALVVVKVC